MYGTYIAIECVLLAQQTNKDDLTLIKCHYQFKFEGNYYTKTKTL